MAALWMLESRDGIDSDASHGPLVPGSVDVAENRILIDVLPKKVLTL